MRPRCTPVRKPCLVVLTSWKREEGGLHSTLFRKMKHHELLGSRLMNFITKMKNFHLVTIFVILFTCSALKDDYCERNENGSCKKDTNSCDNEDEPCFLEEKLADNYPVFEALSRLNDAKVGQEQEYMIDGFKLKLITRSKKPLLFEIPNSVTDDEIAHIIEKAENSHYSGGLFKSEARGGLTPEDSFKPSSAAGKAFGPAGQFINWDLNDDDIIDLPEVAKFCRNYNFMYFKDGDVQKMLKIVGVKEFDDGVVNRGEFENMNTLGIENYLNIMMREHPKFRQRTSDQVWLPMATEYDPLLARLRKRFGKLFKIPQRILLGSEHMQVVRYGPDGHYHAHHDSETEKATDKPCCHHTDTNTVSKHNKCRLCRFMTIMIYLRQPEEGGETAFPAADNITYSDTAFRRRGNPSVDLYNLSEHCQDANLVIKAKKRTAVAWYNHHLDPRGWLGALDDWSLHGGCEVKKGEKWISNLWITAPYPGDENKPSMYSMEYMETRKNITYN